MVRRIILSAVSAAMLAASCAAGGNRPSFTETTVPVGSSATASTLATTTTESATTTVIATTIEPTSTTTTTTVSTTTTEPDDGPPTPLTGVACSPGAGSGELTLSWDAPPVEQKVTAYRLYVDKGDGRLVQQVNLGADGVAGAGGGRLSATVSPVPEQAPVRLAVTAFDDDGHEAGWNPIDAWYSGAGGACNTGAPPVPADVTISRVGSSGDIAVRFSAPAADVASYSAVMMHNGATLSPVSPIQPGVQLVELIFRPVNTTQPFDVRVVATDHHGFSSAAFVRSCSALAAATSC